MGADPRGRATYDPILQADQLLLLLLAALKVSLDQGLQLIQVLLHPLAVDVLLGRVDKFNKQTIKVNAKDKIR